MKKPKKNKPQPSAKQGGETTGVSPASSGPRAIIRDTGAEPVAERAAVPVLLIALLGALIYFGDIYVVDHGGQLDARVHHPFRTVKDLDDLLPKGEDDALKAKGLQLYKLYCSGCHQNDGNGSPSTFVPPLAGSDWVSPKDPGRIIRVVLNGLQGPITVNGKQWGQAAMLPWRDAMNDEDVAAVLTYVRASWGNKAPSVKADEVKKIREETKDKSGSWTGDELMAIPLKD